MKKTSLIFISAVVFLSLINIRLAQANTTNFLAAVIFSNRTPVNGAAVEVRDGLDGPLMGVCGTNISGFADCPIDPGLSGLAGYLARALYPYPTYFGQTTFGTDANGNGKVTICPDNLLLPECDAIPPEYSDVNGPGSVYSPTETYNFNITWTDENAVDTVILELDGQNYTVTGNEFYSKTFTGLSAGTYNYKWYANDTANNWAYTDPLNFTVSQGILSGSISGDDVTYPASVSVAPSESNSGDDDTTYYLYRNDTLVSQSIGSAPAADISQLGAGTYVYKLNATGGTNYTTNASIATKQIIVSKGSRIADITFDKTSPITYETLLTSNCLVDNGANDGTWKLYRDGIDVTAIEKGVATRYGANTYSFNCSITGGANWSDSSKQESFIIDKKNANVKVYPLTQAQTYPYTATQYCTDDSSLLNCNIYRNETLITNNTQYSPSAGVYVYKANISDTSNYTYYQDTETLTVVSLPTVTIISPASPYYKLTVPLNFTVDRPTNWTGYSLDGKAIITSGNTTLTVLTNGNHSIIVYANDSSGNMGSSTTNFSYCLGDVTGPKGVSDGRVDIRDLQFVSTRFGAKCGDHNPSAPKYDARADINDDCNIDIRDMSIVAKLFGTKCW